MSRITAKVINRFHETWYYDCAYQLEELINFLAMIRPRIQIPDHCSTSLAVEE